MFCSLFSSLRDCVPSFYSVGAVFGRSDDLVLDPSVTLAHFENALVDIEKIAPGKWGWATWQLLSLLRNIPESWQYSVILVAMLCNSRGNTLQYSTQQAATFLSSQREGEGGREGLSRV